MAKKLFEKAGLIHHPLPVGSERRTELPKPEAKPKTAPGAMMHFLASQSDAIKEAEELKTRLEAFDGASVVRAVDPSRVVASKWANRHASTFESPEFIKLREEIRQSGGNVQPIKVRPLAGREDADFEIVFGHRRHRACLDLALPVLAMVEAVSDTELFAAMDRENRQRKDLSPWEQGLMYRKALDDGLYPSLRRLAEVVGADPGNVSKALTLARLPDAVIEAFQTPLVIQYNWGPALSLAVQKDPEGTMARARAIALKKLGPRQVLNALTGAVGGVVPYNSSDLTITSTDGKRVARISHDADGKSAVVFGKGAVAEARRDELRGLIASFLG
ncbi:MAG: ParB/RepB/Spo0J family partition protein [Pseudomonadota bacterium]|nr:ParB/RepB/Spo0J family partition protein [Pseudomonadota bacterium]